MISPVEANFPPGSLSSEQSWRLGCCRFRHHVFVWCCLPLVAQRSTTNNPVWRFVESLKPQVFLLREINNEFLPYKTPEQPRLSFKQTGPDYRSSLYNCVETELTENFAFRKAKISCERSHVRQISDTRHALPSKTRWTTLSCIARALTRLLEPYKRIGLRNANVSTTFRCQASF